MISSTPLTPNSTKPTVEELNNSKQLFLNIDKSILATNLQSNENQTAQKAANSTISNWNSYISTPSPVQRPLAFASLVSCTNQTTGFVKPYQLLGEDIPKLNQTPKPLLVSFIAELRTACEPLRDAAREQSEHPDVTKNIQRKAVAAASTVDELRQLESKASNGRNMRVEECITAVTTCIRNQGETFKDVLELLQIRADQLRVQWRDIRKRAELEESVRKLTTGILSNRIQELPDETNDDNEENHIEEEEEDRQDISAEKSEEHKRKDPLINGSNNVQLRSPRWSENLRNLMENAKVWPDGDVLKNLGSKKRSPIPFFNTIASSNPDSDNEEIEQLSESIHDRESVLSEWINHENHVLRNVYSTKRLKMLHNAAVEIVTRKLSQTGTLLPVQGSQLSAQASNDTTPHKQQRNDSSSHQHSPVKVEDTEIENLQPRSKRIHPDVSSSIWEIGNTERSNSSSQYEIHTVPREYTAMRSTIALLCVHSGFTHASSNALDLFTDVIGRTIEKIAENLKTTREVGRLISEPRPNQITLLGDSHDPLMHQVRAICSARAHSGLPDLYTYYYYNIGRTVQSIYDSETKLRLRLQEKRIQIPHDLNARISRRAKELIFGGLQQLELQNTEDKKGDDDKSDMDRGYRDEQSLNNEEFLFGYLNETVHLDILGKIRVPWELITKKTNEIKSTSPEKQHHETETKSQTTNPKEPLDQGIKAEASLMDV